MRGGIANTALDSFFVGPGHHGDLPSRKTLFPEQKRLLLLFGQGLQRQQQVHRQIYRAAVELSGSGYFFNNRLAFLIHPVHQVLDLVLAPEVHQLAVGDGIQVGLELGGVEVQRRVKETPSPNTN